MVNLPSVNPNQPIPGEGEHQISISQGKDPSQAMPGKKGVLDRITSSKAFDVAKIVGKIGAGVVGATVLFSLLPATMVLYVIVAGFGAPFGAHITAGEGENKKKLDSIDVGDAMVQMHYQAIMSVVDWMKPSSKKETSGKNEFEISDNPPEPYPYDEEDLNIKPTPDTYPHTDLITPYDEEPNTPDEDFSNPFADDGTSSSESEGTHSTNLSDEIERQRIQNNLNPKKQLH